MPGVTQVLVSENLAHLFELFGEMLPSKYEALFESRLRTLKAQARPAAHHRASQGALAPCTLMRILDRGLQDASHSVCCE